MGPRPEAKEQRPTAPASRRSSCIAERNVLETECALDGALRLRAVTAAAGSPARKRIIVGMDMTPYRGASPCSSSMFSLTTFSSPSVRQQSSPVRG